MFLLYLSLGSETAESFHVTISRQLNSRIVVPTAGNVSKFRPKLQKPVVKTPEPLTVPSPKRPRALDAQGVLTLSHHHVPNKALRLVKSTKMKNVVLDDYEEEFGDGKPIVTSQLGTSDTLLQPPSQCALMKSCSMKPELEKPYSSDPICFHNVITLVVISFLSSREIWVTTQLDKLLSIAVPEIKRLLLIDWRPLLQPRYNYELQNSIDMNRVDMATALAVRCGLDPGKIVRTLGGEYTASWRDVSYILENVKSVVSTEDYNHMKRILTSGCPSVLKFEEPLSNKLKMIERGNQKSVLDNPDGVNKIMNKEDR